MGEPTEYLKEPTEYLEVRDWITAWWEESKDRTLNTILLEELNEANVPLSRDIQALVPDTDNTGTRWWELPVKNDYHADGSVRILFRFKPSEETYDAARTYIRTSITEMETFKDPLNFFKALDYSINLVPFMIEAGKMKFNKAYNNLKR